MENEKPNDAPAGPENVVLTITYNGKDVQVSGPLPNKVLCYGLLKAAEDAIFDFNKLREIQQAMEAHKNGLVNPSKLSIQ